MAQKETQETVEYYKWLIRIERAEFERELLDIGFHRIFFMPDEAAEIIAQCEERLIQEKVITEPFTATQIQGGILKEYLIEEDYLVPQKRKEQMEARHSALLEAVKTTEAPDDKEDAEEEEELDVYIPEDREVESQCTRKTAQQIQTAIMENLRQEFGAAASLPEDAAKDLILQGLRQIRVSCKLQEAAAKYRSEGFLRIYIACTGTEAQKLIDLLENMFGELDPEDVDPKQLESKVTKVLRQEAATSEEAVIKTAHGQIPADRVTRIPITMADIPPEFGIPPECIPETENVKEVSAKNPAKKITKFYYICKVCQHSSQNKISMLTHTRQCLKIKLICQVCSKEYESANYAEKHIKEAHRGE